MAWMEGDGQANDKQWTRTMTSYLPAPPLSTYTVHLSPTTVAEFRRIVEESEVTK